MKARIVTPGEVLGDGIEYDAGTGTYAFNGQIRASAVGIVNAIPIALLAGKLGTLTVMREGAMSMAVPEAGALVTCRITRISPLQANAEILLLAGVPVAEPFHAVIRKENVRESEIDKVGGETEGSVREHAAVLSVNRTDTCR
jgi:exosome complex component CSL4